MHKALQKKYTPQQQAEADGQLNGNSAYPEPGTNQADNPFKSNGQPEQSQPVVNNYPTVNHNAQYTTSGHQTNAKVMEETINYLDEYNCPKTGIRFSSDFYPNTKRAMKSSKFPFTAILQPFATVYPAESFPVVQFGANQSLVRCNQCRAYINPFSKFLDDGSKYRCNICNCVNGIPNYYYANLTQTGERVDKHDRVELCCGIYDIKAGTDYMARPPVPPTFVFLIDVSQEAVTTGMLGLAASVLQDIISNDLLPGGNRTQITIIAFDSHIHYFMLKAGLKFPQMVSVCNPEEFDGAPFPDDVIINVHESKSLILNLINSLPTMFANNKNRSSSLIPAIQSMTKAVKHVGGRVFVLQAASSVIGEAALKLKTSPQTADKKALFIPSGPDASNMSAEIHQNFLSANFFIFSETYKNVITIGDLVRNSAGEMFYYPNNAERQHKFFYEFKNAVVKDTTWEAVFRLRVSAGWKIINRLGNYSIKSTDLLSVPNLDENKSILYEFEMDDELPRAPVFYIQTALLYTTTNGERRIRVINYGVPLTDRMKDVFLKADAQVVGTTLYRRALARLYQTQDPSAVRSELMMQSSELVREMCRECAISKPGAYVDSLATFPLMILGMVKGAILSTSGITATPEMDYRNTLRLKLNAASVEETMLTANPYLFALHSMIDDNTGFYDEEGNFAFPQLLSLTFNNLSNDGLYLLDDGLCLYLLVGSQVSGEILQNLFGIGALSEIAKLTEDHMYHNSKDPLVDRIYNLITELRQRKNEKYAYLYIIKEGEKSPEEFEFYMKLVEDKINHPQAFAMSYAEFTNKLHMG